MLPSTSIISGFSTTTRGQQMHWRLSLPQWGLVIAVLVFLPWVSGSAYVLQVAVVALIFAILAVSLTLISGSAGLINVGHAALFGIGAYLAALSAKNAGLPLEAVLPIAAFGTAAITVVLGIPVLRLSGHAVALGTLALGIIVWLVLLNWISVTRGPMGIPGVPSPNSMLFGGFVLRTLEAKYWLTLGLFGLTILLAHRLIHSPVGRTWRAIREDRPAAHAAGVPVTRYLAMAFAASGFIAGLAGTTYAYLHRFVSPDSFMIDTSFILLSMVVLGGLGNITGAVMAGAALAILPEVLRGFDDYRMIIYGLVLLLCLRFRPQGLAGVY